MKTVIPCVLVSVALICQACDTTGGGFHERHVQVAEDSAKPEAVSGGQSFEVTKPYEVTFEEAVTYLKKQNYTVESASKDAGQITTAMEVSGGWRQTGSRVEVSLIKNSDTNTTVKVAATEQYRFKLLQVEPWGDPTVNATNSAAIAGAMKTAL